MVNKNHDGFRYGTFKCVDCGKLTRHTNEYGSQTNCCPKCNEKQQHENWHSDNGINCDDKNCPLNKQEGIKMEKDVVVNETVVVSNSYTSRKGQTYEELNTKPEDWVPGKIKDIMRDSKGRLIPIYHKGAFTSIVHRPNG